PKMSWPAVWNVQVVRMTNSGGAGCPWVILHGAPRSVNGAAPAKRATTALSRPREAVLQSSPCPPAAPSPCEHGRFPVSVSVPTTESVQRDSHAAADRPALNDDPVSVARGGGRPVADRLPAVDLLRGLVMVIMALDHVRGFFYNPYVNPTDLSQTT